ncbi:hypothetical protein BGZ80_004053 [Entomortierella chlamydospora]|uniref:Thioredoxin n=1 Tax=Entomortierella chlamydospora TaxID=101097 RepID=A0A9P6MMJ1_9FUNG|nr:hypothetical protein BGZ79_008314 [Entomortierella chlamydospora]KAG0007939.1 hypothetical protein BGZ80_004053 [Entomortierella chlamydospora]
MVRTIATTAEYNDLIQSGKKVIVNFTASWCGPCKLIVPKFEELSKKYSDIEFVKVDIDKLRDVSHRAGITSMPTFQTYYNGLKSSQFVGASNAGLEGLVEDFAKI